MSATPPKSPELSDKSKKYDRQLRLWGDHGQTLLENANICLVNATALGCEILKSLVLPGIGGFTIADNTLVTEEDLGINFFLTVANVGKSKASSCMKNLQELNSDVRADYVDESVDYILNHRPTFFKPFDIVVATNLSENELKRLSDCLWDANIPLFYCRSLGFLGTIRLQIKEHCIVEMHSETQHYDLRIEHPFPALEEFLKTTEITNKVPWLLILHKYLQKWKELHEGSLPATFKEKKEFQCLIRNAQTGNEENFDEAIRAVNKAFGSGVVTTELNSLFNDDSCLKLHKDNNPFWIMVRALKDFIQEECNNGLLPLSGVVPDMTADTIIYINLQNIFRQQALQDAASVYRKCQSYLKELGLPEETLNEKTVRLFCREAIHLKVMRGSKISTECEKCDQFMTNVQGSLAEHYIALRAYERFLNECGSIPGELYVENDTLRFKIVASKMLSDWGVTSSISDDLIHEICRYGGAEVHSISAFIGGCAAQEVIKVITKQYAPIDNTFVYNGITSETVTLKL